MNELRAPIDASAPLGGLTIAQDGRARMRRKAFDVVLALGAGRDLATRIAGEVSDVARWLERYAHGGRVDLVLERPAPGAQIAFAFAWDAHDADAGGRVPTALAPAPTSGPGARRSTYDLRVPEVAIDAVERARALLEAHSREELFARLEASHEALRRSTDQAREAGEAKARFLANMSHEIRTPMNAILGMNRRALGTDLTREQREYLEKIEASSRHLLAIIDDVLDYSKLEAGKVALQPEALSVADVLDDVATLVGGACAAKGLRLTLDVAGDVPDVVEGDALRLRQVLVNLASNAVKFTAAGEVTISVRRREAPADAVALRFAVRDTGIGLTTDQRRGLFSSFTQADGTITRRFGGTGLGLAISKSLVQLMQGEIGVDSRPGAGSTFWFTARFGHLDQATVPADRQRAPGRAPPQAVPAFDPASKVLVVEDNALNQEVAVALLQEVGLAPDVVGDGRQALEALRRQRYALVLMDVQMPVMDGLSATRELRRDPKLRAVPVVAMTANALPGDREAYLAAGMDDVVTKPIEPDELWRALRAWLPERDEHAKPNAQEVQAPAHDDAPPSPDALLPRHVAGLDVDRGLRFTRGRADLYLDFLRRFLDDQDGVPARIADALAGGEAPAAERAAHTLRGLAACLGAGPLADAAEGLENALRTGAAARTVTAAADVLADEHRALFAALDPLRTRPAE
ncbi:MAG: ATP-binding protein [Trueperaceae bacterium]